jgi:hypothetical protein
MRVFSLSHEKKMHIGGNQLRITNYELRKELRVFTGLTGFAGLTGFSIMRRLEKNRTNSAKSYFEVL